MASFQTLVKSCMKRRPSPANLGVEQNATFPIRINTNKDALDSLWLEWSSAARVARLTFPLNCKFDNRCRHKMQEAS